MATRTEAVGHDNVGNRFYTNLRDHKCARCGDQPFMMAAGPCTKYQEFCVPCFLNDKAIWDSVRKGRKVKA